MIPESPVAGSGDKDRFRNEEQRAITSLTGWIGHPAIPGIIRGASLRVAAAVAPVARHLATQRDVIWFCWNVFEIAPVEPGWARPRRTWWLTRAERAAIDPAKDAFRIIVVDTADALTAAGVTLVPSWAGDLAVVAELLLLQPQDSRSPGPSNPSVLRRCCNRRRTAPS